MFSFSAKISCIIVAGSVKSGCFGIEVFTGEFHGLQLSSLPLEISDSSLVLHNGTILICGGWKNFQKCLQSDHGQLIEHSTLNKERYLHSAITTPIATFLFVGHGSKTTYEYLPKDSTIWHMGKNTIPIDFVNGCAIAVKSKQEILLIGSSSFLEEDRIVSFNINDYTFKEFPSVLNVGRYAHTCAFIPNTNKIMIAGGYKGSNSVDLSIGIMMDELDSTEILDTDDGSITMASPLNFKRGDHGMGVITINGEDRLAVFGGRCDDIKLDSIELYNTRTEKWEIPDFKLKEPKEMISFLTVKLGDIISKL